MLETSLYSPVKSFLEGLGLVVKGEIGGCDLLALSGDFPPIVVICELKLRFNLELVLQGVDRMAVSDEVWLAASISARGKGAKATGSFGTFVGALVSDCSAFSLAARFRSCSARRHWRRAEIPDGVHD